MIKLINITKRDSNTTKKFLFLKISYIPQAHNAIDNSLIRNAKPKSYLCWLFYPDLASEIISYLNDKIP